MAEGLAQKWLKDHKHKDWLVISAGVFANEGMPTSGETVQVLADRGISFDGTSTLFTKEMAKAATIVFCMSGNHLARANEFMSKAELLDPNGDIDDPIGRGQSVYDALANQMEQLVAKKLESLTSQGA